jgi:hypothetical protein
MWINGICKKAFTTNVGAIDITSNNPDIVGYMICYATKEDAIKAAKNSGVTNYKLFELEVTKNDTTRD